MSELTLNDSIPNFELKPYLRDVREQVDHALSQMLSVIKNPPRIVQAMQHSLMAGGKRLRPILCIAAFEALVSISNEGPADKRANNAALVVGCALEMVHTYSLIHDDLPAMDDDQLRRGRPTCHIQFDEATAVLAGDALLTLAFEILSRSCLTSAIPAHTQLQLIQEISQAAGYQGMIQGQMLDMAAEGQKLDSDGLEHLHGLKTGCLIRAAIRCGATIGQASAEHLEEMNLYADAIGLAFQVKDDILNVEGDPANLGKQTGTDQLRQKATYPALLGMQKARQMLDGLIGSALQSLRGFGSSADPLRALAGYVRDRHR